MMIIRLRLSQRQPAYVSSGAGTAKGALVRAGRAPGSTDLWGPPQVCSPWQWPAMGVWASSRGFAVRQQDREEGRQAAFGRGHPALRPGQARGGSGEVGWPGADHSSASERSMQPRGQGLTSGVWAGWGWGSLSKALVQGCPGRRAYRPTAPHPQGAQGTRGW